MTPEIALVFVILTAALVLFVTERVPMDLVAILVLVVLAITGLVSPGEALSGFSNAAVVTVWAVFILSGGLARTGAARVAGDYMGRLAGGRETYLLAVILLVAGLLSAVMNSVGVAALLLPVVMDLARRVGRSPARYLMPLAYASLLGGLVTLIGTPSNILISDALRQAGLPPFGMFDFARLGLPILVIGLAYLTLLGPRLLPERAQAASLEGSAPPSPHLGGAFQLEERLFTLRVPSQSVLAGRTLDQVRLGAALGMNVVSITRAGELILAPERNTVLRAGDQLLAAGRSDWFEALREWRRLEVAAERPALDLLLGSDQGLAEVRIAPSSDLVGLNLRRSKFRSRFGVHVLAVALDGKIQQADLGDIVLGPDRTLLVLGSESYLDGMIQTGAFASVRRLGNTLAADHYRLTEHLIAFHVPPASALDGCTLADSRLGESFGLQVLGIRRDDRLLVLPDQDAVVTGGDVLVVQGRRETIALIGALQDLAIEPAVVPDLAVLESEGVGLAEVILSPYSRVAGQSLRDLRFREKYDLNVLAVWREGRAYRSRLADLPLKLGDVLLVYGQRARLAVLGAEPDFIVLTESVQVPPRLHKAPVAVLIMTSVLAMAILGWLPIAIAAVAGAAAMVLAGCLTMDEAYRAIDWRAIFLIAGMLPLGMAMESTQAAQLLASGLIAILQPLGWVAVVAGLFLLTNLTTQVMPTAAVAVLMAPIALGVAADLHMSPQALVMVVGVAAAATLMSPVAHPANVMVMGPGAYRFQDYFRLGLPLTLIILVVVVVLLPLAWPLYP